MIGRLLAAQSGIPKMSLAGAAAIVAALMATAHVKSRTLKPWLALSLSPD
jgi:hypothetical protein